MASGTFSSQKAVNEATSITFTFDDGTTKEVSVTNIGETTNSNSKFLGSTFTLDVYNISKSINASDAK